MAEKNWGETANLIKEALKVVDELGKLDEEYIMTDEKDYETLEKLIKKAKELKKNKLWKL
jgi:hypothetical protein